MVDERYRILSSNHKTSWMADSPVLFLASNLLLDKKSDEIIFQGKFRNVSEKDIIAMFIEITCFDIEGNLLNKEEKVSYLDLNVIPYKDFGNKKPQLLSNKATRDVHIGISKVIFSDKSQWVNNNKQDLRQIVKQELLKDLYGRELTDEYVAISKFDYREGPFRPIEEESYWLCTCGAFNRIERSKCNKCQLNKEWIFINSSRELLSERIDRRKEEELKKTAEEEEARKKKEEEKRQWRMEQLEKIKKYKKIGIITVVILIITMITGKIAIPALRYNNALKKFNNEEFELAYTAFERLGDYKDSKEKLSEAAKHLHSQSEFSTWRYDPYEYNYDSDYKIYQSTITTDSYSDYLMAVDNNDDTYFVPVVDGEGYLDIYSDSRPSSPKESAFLRLIPIEDCDTKFTLSEIETEEHDYTSLDCTSFSISADITASDTSKVFIVVYEVLDSSYGTIEYDYSIVVNGNGKASGYYHLELYADDPGYEIKLRSVYEVSEDSTSDINFQFDEIDGSIKGSYYTYYSGDVDFTTDADGSGLLIFTAKLYDGNDLISDEEPYIRSMYVKDGGGSIHVSESVDSYYNIDDSCDIDVLGYIPFISK